MEQPKEREKKEVPPLTLREETPLPRPRDDLAKGI
jgi:hypothetical protein